MKRPFILVAVVTIAAMSLGLRQRDFPTVVQGKYYVVKSTLPREKCEPVLKMMDIVYKTYCDILKVNPGSQEKNVIVIYKDQAEMKEREKEIMKKHNLSFAYAFYNPTEKSLIGHLEKSDEYAMQTFAHEGMHQFVMFALPAFNNVPVWYSEGIADCIGNSRIVKDKLFMCLKDGAIARARLATIQPAVRDKTFIPWKQFFAMSNKDFYAKHTLCYAQAWSICHFLLTYPAQEESGKQIPNGKYRKVLAYLHEALVDPATKKEEAYAQVFKTAGKSIDALEKEWKEYILGFDMKADGAR